jgi:hypothetical protein
MRKLALAKRAKYGVATASLGLRVVRRIYKIEGIKIDSWNIKGQKIRAAYFCDDNDYSVLLNKNLPRQPKLFSLVHELKHHYVDQEKIKNGQIKCGDYNANQTIEIGAEVFAAEFIYPEDEMRILATQLGISERNCSPKEVVQFKRRCAAPVSYKFIVKRFEWFGFCERGEFSRTRFQKLEERLYGLPIYKQDWFKRYRVRKRKVRVP